MSHPRVVMVLPAYLPESYGGAEQQTRRMSQALSRKGVRVTLIAPRLKSETPALEEEGAVSVRRFKLGAWPNLGGRHFASFVRWCACVIGWLLKHRDEYDVIHVIHGRLHAFPAVVAGKWLNKPIVIKVGRGGADHFDLTVVYRKRLFGPFFARRIADDTTAWVANSREIIQDLEGWSVPSERIHAIPNGIAIPERPATGSNDGIVRFLAMGRLDPEKGLDQAVRALATLPKHLPVRLVILGDGQCRQDLVRLSHELDEDGRVAFPGAVSDVTPFLREADFYLSSSLSEGMSNALLEAMSFAVPPVASRVSGVADLIEDGVSGLLFEPGDEAALAQRLGEAVSMPQERRRVLGLAAQGTVRARFAIDSVAEQHLALYENLPKDGGASIPSASPA